MTCILNIDNLSVFYGNKQALKKLSLEIEKGDFVGLLGSNGAGKSTLVNAMVGFQKATTGTVLYNIEEFQTKKNLFSAFGFSPQTSVMDYYTTVWDNVMLGVNLAGKKGRIADELCTLALKTVRLLDKKDELVESLSGGQLQRVQIARAIAHKPDIYILDEPTVGLDVESSEIFLDYLKSESEAGKTIIVSSHDIQLLEMFCTKILFLKEGEAVFWGNIDDFIDNSINAIHVTFKNKLTVEQSEWLKEYKFPVEIKDSKNCVVHLPKSYSMIIIVQDFSKLSEVESVYIKDKGLRETYLEKVKKENVSHD